MAHNNPPPCCGVPDPTPRAELAERLATALWTGEWNYTATRLSWADRRTIIAALRGELPSIPPGAGNPGNGKAVTYGCQLSVPNNIINR